MISSELLSPQDIKRYYPDIVPVFQDAFAGEPWYEITKCVDRKTPQRCRNGLSSVALNATCDTCSFRAQQPAYTYEEVITDFEKKSSSSATIWYIEKIFEDIALAGYASRKNIDQLMSSSYRRTPSARQWLESVMGGSEVAWLHELFADPSVRRSGNLSAFQSMCEKMMDSLGTDMLAYCTINPRMVAAAKKSFGNNMHVYAGSTESPDHRDFVLIKK